MPKKKDFVRVTTRVRFRENTTFMRAHETMVATGSLMNVLSNGIFGFMQNFDPDCDLIYSDEDDDNFNQQNQSQKLKPHPRLEELDDEECEQIKESLEEEQKRKSKSVKNKRKKMRKKQKKQQEKEDDDQDVSPQEEQEKTEHEELNEEDNIDNYKEIIDQEKNDKSTSVLYDKPYTEDNNSKVLKEENVKLIDKPKDNPPENIDEEQSTSSITKSVPGKKTKKKSKQIEKTQITQNNSIDNGEVNQLQKEKPIVNEPVKVKTKENTVNKQDENRGENVDTVLDEYAKKSREMAAIGNRLAANGQHKMAIPYFTEAIKFNPKEYRIFGNRSFCFEKMQQFEEALSDAEVSLSMEPNWIKGLFRKGKALNGLKKYYEASLAYIDVLKLDSTSQEAAMELKRSQTLHLMEMGFSWSQSTNALKAHSNLEEAIEALFNGEFSSCPEEKGACQLDVTEQFRADDSVQEWNNVQLPTESKPQTKGKVQPPAPDTQKQDKPDLFPVWVGYLAPTVEYLTLQEVFSRAGKVFSIKVVLEHDCAFVNYTRKEDSARAIQILNGLVLEGYPLSVRYPSSIPPGIGVSKDAQIDPLTPPSVAKECFFWRTFGCNRSDCSFTHIPQNSGIDSWRFSNNLTLYTRTPVTSTGLNGSIFEN